jgi:hypothetical protein
MSVFMCIYIYVSIYICIYIYIHNVCTHIYIYIDLIIQNKFEFAIG